MTISLHGNSELAPPGEGHTSPAIYRKILRFRNILWARIRLDAASVPALVRLVLTDSNECLSPAEWDDLIEQASPGTALRLEGPDVLGFQATEGILMAADRRGLEVALICDGPRLEDAAPMLYGLGLSTLVLRLYGTEPAHNAALGASDAFERTALGALSLKGISCGAPLPRIVAAIMITPLNQHTIVESVECAFAMGADQVTVMHSLAETRKNLRIDAMSVAAQVRNIQSRWRTGLVDFSPRLTLRQIEAFYSNGSLTIGPNSCLTPWRSVTVDSSGAVSLCCDGPVGNMRRESLASAFNSPAARSLRSTLRRGFRLECHGCSGRFGGSFLI